MEFQVLTMRNYLILFIVLLCTSSCEKIINLNLNNTEPKIVIESIFTDVSMRHTVSISNTANFDSNNTPIPISGAIVVLKEENGPTLTFTESTPGNYISSRYKGKPGKKYTLSVTVNEKTYAATSIMPLPVPIKSINQAELSFFGKSRKIVELNYLDPAGIPNFYYSRVFINDVKRDRFSVDSDRFNDGKQVKSSIFTDESELKHGDVVKIQLLTIDENVYRYLFSITQITGNGGPPTVPANPNSNFDNGALGFFSASTSTEQTLIVD